MNIKNLTTQQIKEELQKITTQCRDNCEWVHENRKHKQLLNEYEKRVLHK